MAGYKDYDNLLALLHFDGSHGSTTVTDTSSGGLTWTMERNGILSTAIAPKFGTSSFYSNMSDGIVASSALVPATANFSIEAWIYSTSTGGGADYYFSQHNGASPYFRGGMSSTGKPWFHVDGTNLTGSSDIPINQWFHWALSRQGNVFRLFVNGVQVATSTITATITQSPFYIGSNGAEGFSSVYVDEFAAHNYAKYTSNFTPLTYAYADYQLNDKLIPRKDLAIRKPLRVNQNITINRIGI